MSDHPGALYVIANPAWPGWFKVGRAEFGAADRGIPSAAVRGRLTQYNTGDPERAYQVVEEVYAACCHDAERYAREFFNTHLRVHGEWVRGPRALVTSLVERACAIARMPPKRRGEKFLRVLAEVKAIETEGMLVESKGSLLRESLGEEDPDLLFCDGFDDALIGVVTRFGNEPVAAYDREKIIKTLMRDMSREEAEEFFSYNIIGAWVGERTPAFIELRK